MPMDSRKPKGAPTNKQRNESSDAERSHLFDNLSTAFESTIHRDAVVTKPLAELIPDIQNARFGQAELLSHLDQLKQSIKAVGASDGSVPDYSRLQKSAPNCPQLTDAAQKLFDHCVNLANTYLDNAGYADSPPKVLPANDNGQHEIRFGHRRYIAYQLAQPITGVDQIDVLVDKSRYAKDPLHRAVGQLTENVTQVGNTLAEQLMAVRRIAKIHQEGGVTINKARLARSTGLERTKLGRMLTIVENGGAEDSRVLQQLHDAGIEDTTAVELVFKQEREQWPTVISELIEIGPTAFRSRYRTGAAPAPTPPPQPEPTPTNSAEGQGQSEEQDPPSGDTATVRREPAPQPEAGEPVGSGAGEPAGEPEPQTPPSKPADTGGAADTPDTLTVGAQQVITVVCSSYPGLEKQIGPGTPTERLESLARLIGEGLQ